jgi:hypothetical protein
LINRPLTAVDTDRVPGFKSHLVKLTAFFLFLADKIATSHDTCFAKPIGHNSRMRGYAAPGRKKAVRRIYFPDVIRNGIIPNKN